MASHDDAPLPAVALARRQLRSGLAGFPRFLHLLAPAVSPEEAETARRLFRRQLAVLGLLVAGAVVPGLLTLRWKMDALDDVLAALFLVSLLAAGAWLDIPFLGRVVFTLALLGGAFQSEPGPHWADVRATMGGLLALAGGLGMGWLFDVGVTLRPGRAWPALRRLSLALSGAIAAAAMWSGGEWRKYPCAIAAVALWIVWSWWPAPWIERRRPWPSADVALLLEAAAHRWIGFVGARALAVVLGLLPFFLFLNGLGIQERLVETAPAAAGPVAGAAVRSEVEALSARWFWPLRGRFLTEADLREPPETAGILIYAVEPEAALRAAGGLDEAARPPGSAPADEAAAAFAEIGALAAMGAGAWRPVDCRAWSRLVDRLQPDRVASANAFNDAWRARPSRMLLLLERRRGEGKEICYAQAPLGVFAHTDARLAAAVRRYRPAAVVMVAFGLLGFLFLWRRGGDSPVARWIGVWLVLTAGAVMSRWAHYFVPALKHQLWLEPMGAAASTVLLNALNLLDVITWFAPILLDIPLAAIWVHLCWPASPRLLGGSAWARAALTAGRIALLVVVVRFVDYSLGYAMGFTSPRDVSPIDLEWRFVGSAWFFLTLVTAALVWLGRLRRHRRLGRLPSPAPARLALLALFCLQTGRVLLMSTLPTAFDPSGRLWDSRAGAAVHWAGLAAMLAVLVIGAYLVVRHDFLHVARPRDVTLLIFAVALPALFDKGGDLARGALTGTTLFSGAGVEILAVLITLLLVRPLAELVERGVRLATVSGLARIERGVAAALDAMIAAPDEAGRSAAVEALLARLGVTRHAWYASTGDGRFALRLSRLDTSPAPVLETSPGLRARLGRLDHFLDLRAVAREWPLFFHQFELHRMALATGARYVLPVRVGATVWGLLLLGEGPGEQHIARDAAARPLAELGVPVVTAGARPPATRP